MATSSKPATSILAALATVPRRSSDNLPPRSPAGFCIEGRVPLDTIALEVSGLGQIPHPVPPETAAALHAASKPARHGLREATRLDRRVRDTGEIAAQALTLRWKSGGLRALLAEVARGLGLPRLEAHVHNLLVYAPGQFFKPHQDTEKHPGMVATLVLVWPSPHIGGELRVRVRDTEANFTSEHLRARALRWCAFYADCQHEVMPVTDGWRIVLTFDLVVPSTTSARAPRVHQPLLAAMRTQLGAEADPPRTTPWVLLLDHQYTEHGLRWNLLKGMDRVHAGALRAAAEVHGFTVHLALAKIHQQWTATSSYGGRYDDSDEAEPDELIDEDMALDFWVGADDRPRRKAVLPIRPHEVESLTATDESFLVDEEYEGYMGNYGETFDYWYRRAAVVIQNPLTAEAGRFTTDFDAALTDALRLADEGRDTELTQRLRAAAKTIEAQCRSRGRTLLRAYLTLARSLSDATQARWLCEGFSSVDLEPGDAPVLVALTERWGLPWMRSLIRAWTLREGSPPAASWSPTGARVSRLWPRALAKLVRASQKVGLHAAIVEELLVCCGTALRTADQSLAKQPPSIRNATLEERLLAVSELVAALALSEDTATHFDAIVGHLRAIPSLYPLRALRPLLEALPSGASAPANIRALRVDSIAALRHALARRELAQEDCTVEEVEWTCRCPDCSAVIRWATSPTRDALTLSIAETRREHVRTRLQAADAPIRTETIKTGSPHKLILHKPKDLSKRRRAIRQRWADDLATLLA